MEILSGLNLADHPMFAAEMGDVPYRIKIDYLAPSLQPVVGMVPFMPAIHPTQTYDAAIKSGTQFDILWIPAGTIISTYLRDAHADGLNRPLA